MLRAPRPSTAGDALPPCPDCGESHPKEVLRCPRTDLALPLEGRILDGRFELAHQIGRGGMASVWRARHLLVDRWVALKLIRPEVARDPGLLARFRAEARAAGRIGHINICEILDSGSSRLGPYIVMEHLRGANLGSVLSGGRRLEASTAVMLVREALRGLQAAHEAGIVHRDLKPENVFLHWPQRGAPVVKIMDFGIAKFMDGSGDAQTEHGALLGTPEYMAPEQFRGAALADARTDLWAMGAILYRALTGHSAFGGPTVMATLLMVSSEDPPPISQWVDGIAPELIDVVERCLRKDPTERFADAAALDKALAPFAPGRRDESPWEAALAAAPVAAAEPLAHLDGSKKTPTVATPRDRPRVSVATRVQVMGAGVLLLAALYLGRSNSVPASSVQDAPTVEPQVGSSGERLGDSGNLDHSPVPGNLDHSPVPGNRDHSPVPGNLDSVAAVEPAPDGEGRATDLPPPPPLRSNATAPVLAPPATPRGRDQAPPETPIGLLRAGRYVTPTEPGPAGTHARAAAYCAHLASIGDAGISTWALANPEVAATFAGVRGLRRGQYWSSALWRGKAIVVSLPSGDKRSKAADSRHAKPLCVAKWP